MTTYAVRWSLIHVAKFILALIPWDLELRAHRVFAEMTPELDRGLPGRPYVEAMTYEVEEGTTPLFFLETTLREDVYQLELELAAAMKSKIVLMNALSNECVQHTDLMKRYAVLKYGEDACRERGIEATGQAGNG